MFPGLAGPGTTLDSWLTLTPVWRGSCGGSQRQGPLRVNFFDKFPLLILTTKVLHCGKKGKRTQGVFIYIIYIYISVDCGWVSIPHLVPFLNGTLAVSTKQGGTRIAWRWFHHHVTARPVVHRAVVGRFRLVPRLTWRLNHQHRGELYKPARKANLG